MGRLVFFFESDKVRLACDEAQTCRIDVSISNLQGAFNHGGNVVAFADVPHPTSYANGGDGVAVVEFERGNRGHAVSVSGSAEVKVSRGVISAVKDNLSFKPRHPSILT